MLFAKRATAPFSWARAPTWAGPCGTDPFEVSLDQKIDLLMKADEAMRAQEGVALTKSSLAFQFTRKAFGSSEGSYIEQEYTGTPSTSTVQLPHSPRSQPSLVPVSPRSSRTTSSSRRMPGTATSRGSPLSVKR